MKVAGLVSVLLLISFCARADEPGTTTVLHAKKDIAHGSWLRVEDVEQRSVPNEWVQPRALEKHERGLYVVSPILKGEQISSTKLATGPGGVAQAVPKGYRAWPVSIDSLTAAVIQPGMFVDVVLNVEPRRGRRAGFDVLRCVTLLQNVAVVSVGTAVVPSPAEKSVPTTMTLLVTPDEVQKLLLAETLGPLRYSIRGALEGNTQIPLEKLSVDAAIGIPARHKTPSQPPQRYEPALEWFQRAIGLETEPDDDGW